MVGSVFVSLLFFSFLFFFSPSLVLQLYYVVFYLFIYLFLALDISWHVCLWYLAWTPSISLNLRPSISPDLPQSPVDLL